MSKELETVLKFCLKHAQSAPVAERVSLYRGLAEFCGDKKQAAEFCNLAHDLEQAELRCREFAFRFNNQTL